MNPFLFNPALTGTGDKTNISFLNRTQWSGIPGSPRTRALSVDGPIKKEKIGLGLNIFSDRTDITERLGAYGSYSYSFKLNKEHHLLLGLSFGVLDNQVNFTNVKALHKNDKLLFQRMKQNIQFNGSFGLAYKWKGLEVGFSVPQILESSFEYENNNKTTFYQLSRHFMGSASYNFHIESANLDIKPLILTRAVKNAPFQFDANVLVTWKKIAWLGGSYRSDYAIGLLAGVNIHEKLSLGYSYDVISGTLGSAAGGTHEFMINYELDMHKGMQEKKEEMTKKPPDEPKKPPKSYTKDEVKDPQLRLNIIQNRKIENLQSKLDSLSNILSDRTESKEKGMDKSETESQIKSLENKVKELEQLVNELQNSIEKKQEKGDKGKEGLNELKNKVDANLQRLKLMQDEIENLKEKLKD